MARTIIIKLMELLTANNVVIPKNLITQIKDYERSCK